MNPETDIQAERVKATFEQIPSAARVTLVNATIPAAVLSHPKPNRGVYTWLAVAVLVTAARLTL